MKRKRRTHSAEFKARVALEALKGIKTINQIAQEEGLHPVQVSAWKKELHDGMVEVFASGAAQRHDGEKAERDRARLERKVGQLTMERDFLEKKCEQLGIDLSEKP
jgi:transposase-like protein